MFLLVLAQPGSHGQRPVKQSCCCCVVDIWFLRYNSWQTSTHAYHNTLHLSFGQSNQHLVKLQPGI